MKMKKTLCLQTIDLRLSIGDVVWILLDEGIDLPHRIDIGATCSLKVSEFVAKVAEFHPSRGSTMFELLTHFKGRTRGFIEFEHIFQHFPPDWLRFRNLSQL